MLHLFEPVTWVLWVFLPMMRYVLLPIITGWRIKSYIVVAPVFAFICVAIQFGYATDRINEALLGGLVLIIMLMLDLRRTHIRLCHANSALLQVSMKNKISAVILTGHHG